MTNTEKKELLQKLIMNDDYREEDYFNVLVTMNDLEGNYRDYMTTEPINCDNELKRLPKADYDLCAALLTMLLREDHFDNGSFERRYRSGQVKMIIDRMIELL